MHPTERMVFESAKAVHDARSYESGAAAKALDRELSMTDAKVIGSVIVKHYLRRAARISKQARKQSSHVRGMSILAIAALSTTLGGCVAPRGVETTAKLEMGVKETAAYRQAPTGSVTTDNLEYTATASIQWVWPAPQGKDATKVASK